MCAFSPLSEHFVTVCATQQHYLVNHRGFGGSTERGPSTSEPSVR